MKYPSGDVVKVGDVVELWPGCQGEVMCSMDGSDYTAEFPESEWSHLKQGVLVRSDQAGLPASTIRRGRIGDMFAP